MLDLLLKRKRRRKYVQIAFVKLGTNPRYAVISKEELDNSNGYLDIHDFEVGDFNPLYGHVLGENCFDYDKKHDVYLRRDK